MSKSPYIVYVGTYSEGTYSPEGYKSEGIYVCHMDRETGHIETIKTYSQSVNPTYLAIDEKMVVFLQIMSFQIKRRSMLTKLRIAVDSCII